MLIAFWSPKGGSGTSVVSAGAAAALARRGETRLADMCGDQAALNGLAIDPEHGLRGWLQLGARAPVEALERLAVQVGPGLSLLPFGDASRSVLAPVAEAESGAALAVALRDGPRTIVDLGTASSPATRAVLEVADESIMVLRRCYLALRRGAHLEVAKRSSGIVLIEEPGRALGAQEICEVLDQRVLARIPWKAQIANAVDAGVVTTRLPDALARAIDPMLATLGLIRRRAA